eukprot:TRINITY_DN11561_c0_g1_i1.p1 TRINITY_DN11561_c0_g1~~TRINITY_DN11561_c0_g1_i1.p1  ORF type:complete len:970 (+),score=222.04 TRINITY_DN11561_c0_g1_i1:92-3001(+)
MEVCVLGAEGPAAHDPNVVVSIRAGGSRRQGAVQINRTLHFPVGLRDATPFKVDLLKRVAQGQVDLQQDDHVYEVQLERSDPKEAASTLKLAVSNEPWLCGRTRAEAKGATMRMPPLAEVAEEKPEVDTVGAAARKARQFFDQHNIMHVVQALLEAIIRDRPDQPFEYISTFMDIMSRAQNSSKSRAELEAASGDASGMPAAATAAVGGGAEGAATDTMSASAAAAAAAAVAAGAGGQSTAREGTPNELVRQVKPKCAAAFDAQDPAREGRLDVAGFCAAIRALHPQMTSAQARAVGNGVAHGAKGITLVSFSAAEEAVSQGEALAAEVAGLTQEQYAALRDAATPPAEGGEDLSGLADIRAQMRTVLLDASENGSLEAVLQKNAAQARHAEREDTRQKAEEEREHQARRCEYVAQKVKSILRESCENGRLESVLAGLSDEKSRKGEMDELRELICELLEKAALDGSLDEALRLQRDAPVETAGAPTSNTDGLEPRRQARLRAREALARAAEDGTLSQVLASVLGSAPAGDAGGSSAPGPPSVPAKGDAGGCSAPGPPPLPAKGPPPLAPKPQEGSAHIRAKACELLVKASVNGELDQALSEVRQKRAPTAAAPKPATTPPPMAQAQCQPAGSERAVSPLADLEDLRQRAFVSLSSALETGRLEQALGGISNEADKEKDCASGCSKEIGSKALMSLATRLEAGDLEKKIKFAQGVGRPSGVEEEHLAVSFDVHLEEHTLSGFNEAKQRELCSHIAVNLGCDRVEIVNLRSGSVVCETHAIGFFHEEHQREAVSKVRRGEAVHENVWGVHSVSEEPACLTKMHRASPWLESRWPKLKATRSEDCTPSTQMPSSTPAAENTPRHMELLGRQRELLEEKRAMEERLAKLMQAKNAAPPIVQTLPRAPAGPKPSAPATPRPTAKRPLMTGTSASVQFRDVREVNRGLTSENSRLNAELSRLLAQAAARQQGSQ